MRSYPMTRAYRRTHMVNFNPATYDYKTGLYHNRSGSFLTLEAANATSWICEKCEEGFSSIYKLHEHRDSVHSY